MSMNIEMFSAPIVDVQARTAGDIIGEDVLEPGACAILVTSGTSQACLVGTKLELYMVLDLMRVELSKQL